MSITDEIKSIFLEKGENHFDEGSVTQLSHALQCAQHAEIANSSAEMITACLLHDIGHLLNKDARQAIRNGEDAEHEHIAADYLRSWFGPAVTSPIRWHVDAKRYLCATDKTYFSKLSKGSVRSLEVQGGPFDRQEVASFESQPYYKEAVQLRRWDEASKSTSTTTPSLEHFLNFVSQARI